MAQVTRSPSTVEIQPPGLRHGLGLEELWRYRSLSFLLAKRNLKVRYRQSLLGVIWVLLQPLILMTIFSVFFSLVARGELYGLPYPVFFLCGLAFWLPAVKIVNEGTTSIVANQQLVTRIYLPRAFLPLSVSIATLVDLCFSLLALVIILLRFGYGPIGTWLLVPILIAITYVTALGVALWLAALNTTYRDVQVALPFLIQMWFFLSPILYPAQVVPAEYQPFYYLNPLALVFTASRWALAGAPPPPDFAWVIGTFAALALLVSGYLFFRRREPTFADVLSA